MLQQTTVAAVRPYFHAFTTRWPTVEAMAVADEADVMAAWAGLGYYARARNLIASAKRIVGEYGGHFPNSEAELLRLPGIGRYTAAAIAAIAFGRRSVVVDGNVERVVSRLFAVTEPLPASRPRLYELTDRITPDEDCGDFAQAMMDLGATICTPRRPSCGLCPLSAHCKARLERRPEAYPIKAAKAVKPRRKGVAYWLQHRDHVLLVRRPDKGLLGGMLALPTCDWSNDGPPGNGAPAASDWQDGGKIDHIFTHFALDLHLLCAETERRCDGIWWPIDALEEAGLPTVFAKAAARAAMWRSAA